MKRLACAVGVIAIVALAWDPHYVYAAGRQHQPGAASRGASVFAADTFRSQPVALGAGYWRDGGSVRVRAVQRGLRAAGFRPGPIDGLFGPRTDRATRRFQRAAGLSVDGLVGARTFRALVVRTARHRSGVAHRAPAPGRGQPESAVPGLGGDERPVLSPAAPPADAFPWGVVGLLGAG